MVCFLKRITRKISTSIFRKLVSWDNEDTLASRKKKFKIPDSTKLALDGHIEGKNISIGENCYINDGFRIVSGEHSRITIGDYCAIGRYFSISSITHDKKLPTKISGYSDHLRVEKNVTIGEGVWIGDKVTIVPNITIEDYSIIGANSVVTKNIRPFEIVGGVPARHIGFNSFHPLFK